MNIDGSKDRVEILIETGDTSAVAMLINAITCLDVSWIREGILKDKRFPNLPTFMDSLQLHIEHEMYFSNNRLWSATIPIYMPNKPDDHSHVARITSCFPAIFSNKMRITIENHVNYDQVMREWLIGMGRNLKEEIG